MSDKPVTFSNIPYIDGTGEPGMVHGVNRASGANSSGADIPPGLQVLSQVDQLLVKQKVEAVEAITGFETSNRYMVLNSLGQRIFYAEESTGCCSRMCCGKFRGFQIRLKDNSGNMDIMSFDREFRPCSKLCCCCTFCLQELEVTCPAGSHVIGKVQQRFGCIRPWFDIRNSRGETVLRIKGPRRCRIACCCPEYKFEVLNNGDVRIGHITKQWSGLAKELLTDTDSYGITFPLDLDVKLKATLLAATFLIDFMYFES